MSSTEYFARKIKNEKQEANSKESDSSYEDEDENDERQSPLPRLSGNLKLLEDQQDILSAYHTNPDWQPPNLEATRKAPVKKKVAAKRKKVTKRKKKTVRKTKTSRRKTSKKKRTTKTRKVRKVRKRRSLKTKRSSKVDASCFDVIRQRIARKIGICSLKKTPFGLPVFRKITSSSKAKSSTTYSIDIAALREKAGIAPISLCGTEPTHTQPVPRPELFASTSSNFQSDGSFSVESNASAIASLLRKKISHESAVTILRAKKNSKQSQPQSSAVSGASSVDILGCILDSQANMFGLSTINNKDTDKPVNLSCLDHKPIHSDKNNNGNNILKSKDSQRLQEEQQKDSIPNSISDSFNDEDFKSPQSMMISDESNQSNHIVEEIQQESGNLAETKSLEDAVQNIDEKNEFAAHANKDSSPKNPSSTADLPSNIPQELSMSGASSTNNESIIRQGIKMKRCKHGRIIIKDFSKKKFDEKSITRPDETDIDPLNLHESTTIDNQQSTEKVIETREVISQNIKLPEKLTDQDTADDKLSPKRLKRESDLSDKNLKDKKSHHNDDQRTRRDDNDRRRKSNISSDSSRSRSRSGNRSRGRCSKRDRDRSLSGDRHKSHRKKHRDDVDDRNYISRKSSSYRYDSPECRSRDRYEYKKDRNSRRYRDRSTRREPRARHSSPPQDDDLRSPNRKNYRIVNASDVKQLAQAEINHDSSAKLGETKSRARIPSIPQDYSQRLLPKLNDLGESKSKIRDPISSRGLTQTESKHKNVQDMFRDESVSPYNSHAQNNRNDEKFGSLDDSSKSMQTPTQDEGHFSNKRSNYRPNPHYHHSDKPTTSSPSLSPQGDDSLSDVYDPEAPIAPIAGSNSPPQITPSKIKSSNQFETLIEQLKSLDKHVNNAADEANGTVIAKITTLVNNLTENDGSVSDLLLKLNNSSSDPKDTGSIISTLCSHLIRVISQKQMRQAKVPPMQKPASPPQIEGADDDDMPSSAVELNHKEKYLQKLNRQERVVEEVKLALKPFYQRRAISKDDYKEVLRRAVPKICHSKNGEINVQKIRSLVEAYVRKMKHN